MKANHNADSQATGTKITVYALTRKISILTGNLCQSYIYALFGKGEEIHKNLLMLLQYDFLSLTLYRKVLLL